MLRFEPGEAGWEARALPLWSAVISSAIVTQNSGLLGPKAGSSRLITDREEEVFLNWRFKFKSFHPGYKYQMAYEIPQGISILISELQMI